MSHLCDLSCPPEALKRAAAWAIGDPPPFPEGAGVTLTRAGYQLTARQGCRSRSFAAAEDEPARWSEIVLTVPGLRAAADWVSDGPSMAAAELLVDDAMLLVYQGDAMAGFDTDGSEASEEYLAVAPLDR
jgi:hypothetical protein